jgi:hypothetical protein
MATIKKSKVIEILKKHGISEGLISNILSKFSNVPTNDSDYKKLVKKSKELDKEYDNFIKKHNLKRVNW